MLVRWGCLVILGGCLAACAVPPRPALQSKGVPAAAPKASYLSPDCERMIVIVAASTGEGIAQENRWIHTTYPDAVKLRQSRTNCGIRKVDVIEIQTKTGQKRLFTFDITSFFGKVDGMDLDQLLDG